jgi:hypothetical protein
MAASEGGFTESGRAGASAGEAAAAPVEKAAAASATIAQPIRKAREHGAVRDAPRRKRHRVR